MERNQNGGRGLQGAVRTHGRELPLTVNREIGRAVKRRLSWISWAQVALCSSIFLAGCPGTGSGTDTVAGDATAVSGLTSTSGDVNTNTCGIPSNFEALVNEVLRLVNVERTSRGLNALTLNETLSGAAEDYCCEMIEGGFFSHDNPLNGEGPGERAIKAGYVFLAVGENLAAGQRTPEQAMDDWMASQGHRENILGIQWQEVGIGVRTGGEYGAYWVQLFGNPPP